MFTVLLLVAIVLLLGTGGWGYYRGAYGPYGVPVGLLGLVLLVVLVVLLVRGF